MSPCVLHKMRAFNDPFIISASGEKNSGRELEEAWTERDRAPGGKSAVPARRLEENKTKPKRLCRKDEISALKEPEADLPVSISL